MSKYQMISSGFIVAKINRELKPVYKGWQVDVIDWIGEALAMMKIGIALEKTNCKAQVNNFKIKIPCPVEALFGITFEGCTLTWINGHILPGKVRELVGSTRIHASQRYQVNTGFIHFSFEKGEVELFYNRLPVDERGFPTIPKEQYVIEAITWYCYRQLLLGGMPHPVINFQMADMKWEEYSARGTNRMKQMTVQEREAFAKNWISIIPSLDRGDDFYTDVYKMIDVPQNGNINEFLGTTIQ